MTLPEFDPHRDGKLGFLFGVTVAAVVVGLLWWFGAFAT
jgi:hypothetical protein